MIGGFLEATPTDHWHAFQRVFWDTLFSTITVWLSTILVFLSGSSTLGGWPRFWEAFVISVTNGELYICATALLAPVFWVALDEYPGGKLFPNRRSHIGILVVVNVLAGLIFGLDRSHRITNQINTLYVSLVLFGIALVILYISTVSHFLLTSNIPGEFKKDQNEFLEEFKADNP